MFSEVRLCSVDSDRSNAKLMDVSNGGMLSGRCACLIRDRFSAAASWAGTWRADEGGSHGVVNIDQWHGTADTTSRSGAARVTFGSTHDIAVHPTTERGRRFLPGSNYTLHVIPGEDHVASGQSVREMVRWVVAQ